MELAQGLEAASKDVQELHRQKELGGGHTGVQGLRRDRKQQVGNCRKPDKKKQSGNVCFRCREENHRPPFKDSKCFRCGKLVT